MERECYEEEVQPYRKMDYKPIIYILYLYNIRIIMNIYGLVCHESFNM